MGKTTVKINWEPIPHKERAQLWKADELPRLHRLDAEQPEECRKAVDEIFDVRFASALNERNDPILIYAYGVNATDNPTLGELRGNNTHPCFGSLGTGICSSADPKWRPYVAYIAYPKPYLAGVVGESPRKKEIQELCDFFMSPQSPWWPMPKHVKIVEDFEGFPAVMKVVDLNVPNSMLVNFLIGFRSLVFDVSSPTTYKKLRDDLKCDPALAYYATSCLYHFDQGKPKQKLPPHSWSMSVYQDCVDEGDHRTMSPQSMRLEWRQVEYPITGMDVIEGKTSYKKFVEQNPFVAGEIALFGRGIPNNTIWRRSDGKQQRLKVGPKEWAHTGRALTLDQAGELVEAIATT